MSQTKSLIESDPPSAFIEHAKLTLFSAFQPIISVVHSKIVGHEALIRARDHEVDCLNPSDIFPRLATQLSPLEVNETCVRLHMESFRRQNGKGWLFLNFNPDGIPDRAGVIADFGAWLECAQVPAHQVVVEIIETRAYDERHLAEAVSGFRDLGCLVAIDDFGAGESNFERVWRLRPDIVKLDRAMITEAAINPLVQRILPGIVSLVHEAGALVVMEGIETERQAMIALESDVDFVQGYYFSRPQARYTESTDIRQQFDQLASQIRCTQFERKAVDKGYFASFKGGLEACVSARQEGVGFHDAIAMFLAVAGVQRVYELDNEGYQIGDNAESPHHGISDARFAPCSDGKGANWYRRPYFQRAMAAPGKIQISRPYLSIQDACSCVTLSVAFEHEGELRVICADLDHEQTDVLERRSLRESGIVLK